MSKADDRELSSNSNQRSIEKVDNAPGEHVEDWTLDEEHFQWISGGGMVHRFDPGS